MLLHTRDGAYSAQLQLPGDCFAFRSVALSLPIVSVAEHLQSSNSKGA